MQRTRRSWTRGSFDCWRAIIGINGCGKSTRAQALARGYAASGVRVFVSDPDEQHAAFPSFPSTAAWTAAASAAHAEGATFPTVARFPHTNPVELLELGTRAAEAAGHRVPSLVLFDEGSLLYDDARREAFNKALLGFVTRRRNLGVGAIVLYQWTTMLHYLLLANTTGIDLFRLQDADQARYLKRFFPEVVRLENGGQAQRDGLLARLPYLDRGQFYAVRRGFE